MQKDTKGKQENKVRNDPFKKKSGPQHSRKKGMILMSFAIGMLPIFLLNTHGLAAPSPAPLSDSQNIQPVKSVSAPSSQSAPQPSAKQAPPPQLFQMGQAISPIRKPARAETDAVGATTVDQAVYRLYHPQTSDHFYTTSRLEVDSAVRNGYRFERIEGYIAASASPAQDAVGLAAVYRLVNPKTHRHFYTRSVDERNYLVSRASYRDEGILGYVLANADGGTKPLERFYNIRADKHVYTADPFEKSVLMSRGYRYEGTVGYVADASSLWGISYQQLDATPLKTGAITLSRSYSNSNFLMVERRNLSDELRTHIVYEVYGPGGKFVKQLDKLDMVPTSGGRFSQSLDLPDVNRLKGKFLIQGLLEKCNSAAALCLPTQTVYVYDAATGRLLRTILLTGRSTDSNQATRQVTRVSFEILRGIGWVAEVLRVTYLSGQILYFDPNTGNRIS